MGDMLIDGCLFQGSDEITNQGLESLNDTNILLINLLNEVTCLHLKTKRSHLHFVNNMENHGLQRHEVQNEFLK
jgi:hypothetical protein